MIRSIPLLLCVISTPAWPENPLVPPIFPTLADVTGVEAGDFLNIRALPSASAEDLGDLENGTRVEVLGVSDDTKWSKIHWGETSAWVSSRYLQRVDPVRMENSKLPLPLQCFGTEPFWSMEVTQTGILYTDPETELKFQPIEEEAHAFFDASQALVQSKDYAALIEYGTCFDGMSDREYALSVSLFTNGGALGGCCQIVPVNN